MRTHASADFQFYIRWDCTRGGTPLQNNLTELWSLLHFTLPAIFPDLETFKSLALTRPRRLSLRSIRSPRLDDAVCLRRTARLWPSAVRRSASALRVGGVAALHCVPVHLAALQSTPLFANWFNFDEAMGEGGEGQA